MTRKSECWTAFKWCAASSIDLDVVRNHSNIFYISHISRHIEHYTLECMSEAHPTLPALHPNGFHELQKCLLMCDAQRVDAYTRFQIFQWFLATPRQSIPAVHFRSVVQHLGSSILACSSPGEHECRAAQVCRISEKKCGMSVQVQRCATCYFAT